MSYWISLEKAGNPVEVGRHSEGGTYAVGGINSAELNVTYNYSEVYHLLGFSLKSLDKKIAEDTVQQLEALVEKLGTHAYTKDYWAPTPGNAGHALNILLGWALAHPDAIWRVN